MSTAGFVQHVGGKDNQLLAEKEVISVKTSSKRRRRHRCPACRSAKSVSRGYRMTERGTTNKRVCKNCGGWFSVLL